MNRNEVFTVEKPDKTRFTVWQVGRSFVENVSIFPTLWEIENKIISSRIVPVMKAALFCWLGIGNGSVQDIFPWFRDVAELAEIPEFSLGVEQR